MNIADVRLLPHEDPSPSVAEQRIDLHWHVWIAWSALALVIVTATRADPDLWGHVRFGLDWLHSHRLPAVDPYSFTQDRPWVNHEWLSEVLMAAAFRIGGSAGLVILKSAAVLTTLAVLAWRLRGSSPVVMAAVLTAALVVAMPLTGTVRPQVWSLLALAVLISVLDSDASSTTRRAISLAALFSFWANLHGGWITGATILGVHTAVRVIKAPQSFYRSVAPMITALAATCLNPYGVGLWRFLASTVGASRPDVTEWRPFSAEEPAIMWVSVLVPALVLFALAYRRRTRPRAEVFAVWAVLVAAGLRVSRVAPLAGPALLVLLAPGIREAWGEIGRLRRISAAGAVVMLLPLAVIVAVALPPVTKILRCIPIQDAWAPDREAAAYLEKASGRLWVAFDWGEYAIWHFGPALQVSIDGRRETVYSDKIVQLHRDFDLGRSDSRAAFLSLAPDYVWLRSRSGDPRDWLLAHGYTLAVDTGRSFIAVRRHMPSTGASGSMPLGACFP